MAKDYYEILGVPRTASRKDIVSAYRKIAVKTHPDKSASEEAAFRSATEAYVVLGDEEKRRNYDLQFKIVEKSLTGIKNLHGSNVKVNLKLELREVLRGTTKRIATTRMGLCSKCSGTGSQEQQTKQCHTCNGTGFDLASLVFRKNQTCKACGGSRVQPLKPLCESCKGEGIQVENIQREITVTPLSSRLVTIIGSGNHILGGRPGDLIVDIQVDPDPIYHVQRLDLYRDLKITPTQAILGDVVMVDVFGKSVDINIPRGCQSGSSLTVRQEGVSYGDQRGDLFVKLIIDIPKSVSPEETDLYKQILEFERSERRAVNG